MVAGVICLLDPFDLSLLSWFLWGLVPLIPFVVFPFDCSNACFLGRDNGVVFGVKDIP